MQDYSKGMDLTLAAVNDRPVGETSTISADTGTMDNSIDGQQQPQGNFDGRLLLITKRIQLENNSKLTFSGRAQGIGDIQCGLCLKRCVNDTHWREHLGEHYGVGWKVGEKEIVSC